MKKTKIDEFTEEEQLDARFLPADHSLLSKMQKALSAQLEEELEKLRIEELQKTKVLAELNAEKESVGVNLYENQQKLVRLQGTLEEKENLLEDLRRQKEKSSFVLSKEEAALREKSKELWDLTDKLKKDMDELSKQNLLVIELDHYKKQLDSEIAVEKRTTYKIEGSIQTQEHLKNRQDFLVNNLLEEQQRLKAAKEVEEIRLLAQRDQRTHAREMLREGEEELERMQISKKNLLVSMQKALFELEEKNRMLGVVRESLEKQAELNLKKISELGALKNEIMAERSNAEGLELMIGRICKEDQSLTHQIARIDAKTSKIRAKIDVIKGVCVKSEQEITEIDRQCRRLRSEKAAIESETMKFHLETEKLRNELLKIVSEHKTMEKLHKNVARKLMESQSTYEEKTIELESLENEISRTRLDTLNAQHDLHALQSKRDALDLERTHQEKNIQKYEAIIRENHDAHEKKMHDIAKYNREHDKAKQKGEIGMKGPSELALLQLVKGKGEFIRMRKKLEGDFIRAQSFFVEREMRACELEEKIGHLGKKTTILEQKKIRLNASYAAEQKEIRSLGISLKNLEKEMNRLNDFLSVFGEKSRVLRNLNINLSSEIGERLKELEKTGLKLESELADVKAAKAKILEEIMEAEKQILLWERKIQLEREMIEALDPEVGQQEIQLLKKELHLKELRIAEIRKRHEGLASDIERTINKRENIKLKYNNKSENDENKSLNINSKSQISKNIELLKNSLNHSSKNLNALESEIDSISSEIAVLAQKSASNDKTIAEKEAEIAKGTLAFKESKLMRYINIFMISALQSKAGFLEKGLKKGAFGKTMQAVNENSKSLNALTAFKDLCAKEVPMAYVLPVCDRLIEGYKETLHEIG